MCFIGLSARVTHGVALGYVLFGLSARVTQGVASLALGYVLHWAFSPR